MAVSLVGWGGGGGATTLYGLHRYVRPQRVGFSGIDFVHFSDKLGMVLAL